LAAVALLFIPRILLGSATAVLGVVFLVALAVALVQTLWISPRDVAYRFAIPGVARGACERQARDPALLAAFDNSEDQARSKAKSDPGFECMLQRHAVPVKLASKWPGGAALGPIEYYLSFLEFQENGRAAQKGLDGTAIQRSQLDVLEEHLARQIAFEANEGSAYPMSSTGLPTRFVTRAARLGCSSDLTALVRRSASVMSEVSCNNSISSGLIYLKLTQA
jgi:hypothetical protein